MRTLRRGDTGKEIKTLQEILEQVGFSPGGIDGKFGSMTETAVMAFQVDRGLTADGIVGYQTWRHLKPDSQPEKQTSIPNVTVEVVAKIFTGAPKANLQTYLPGVIDSLVLNDLDDKVMLVYSLATLKTECAKFEPMCEKPSKWNTSPGGIPFDLYDNRKNLGNQGTPDGDRFKGRGYIQLTGRWNYGHFGKILGFGDQLVQNPDLANDPKIAALIFATFIKKKEGGIRRALYANDLASARKCVNGGTIGLNHFTEAYNKGNALIQI